MKKNEFLEYVNIYQKKNFIVYAKKEEKLYKWLKIIYILVFAYQTVLNLITIYGLFYAKKPSQSNIIPTSIASAAVLAAGFVILLFDLGIITFLLNLVSTAFSLPLMITGLLKTSGVWDVHGSFYWRFAIPMTLLLAISLWMGIIALREKIIIKRDTELLKNALYEEYGEEYLNLTPKQIKHFAKTFDPYEMKMTEEKE